ncbi:MAG: rhamnulokinase [Actinomycetota bacterium]|nr:rhamnulokinase [Actinomycetota bacterium]
MTDATVAAVDLGASSGRVYLARVDAGHLELTEAHRFANVPVRVAGTLRWDILGIYRGVLDGLRAAGREAGQLDSIGVDSWAIDYGLVDAAGELLGNPVHYRDSRTDGVMARVLETIPAAQLYQTTGIQFLPFNTIYQVVAALPTAELAAAKTLLMIPDLVSFWLTGKIGAETTNASTTQLVDLTTGGWATGVMRELGIDPELFPALRAPGSPAGVVTSDVLSETGLSGPVAVTAVGSHDTASAVVAVPADTENFGYLSCGTWSLVGLELERPILSEAGRAANFTNEQGVDGTTRFLRNVMGLWLLQECVRTWSALGLPADLETLMADAGRVPAFTALIDPDDPGFLPPGDMPARIAAECERRGQTPPQSQGETVRCILDSLALAYRSTLRQAQQLAGREVDVLHLVGGGVRNSLLCQLTADACGVPVVAGPVEAAATGNALVQARALGAVSGSLRDLRGLVRKTAVLRTYEPQTSQVAWETAARRLR